LRADGHHVIDPEPTTCFEVASGEFRTGPGLPSPGTVAQLVCALALRNGKPLADNGKVPA
jgi:hypothetical protein